MGRMEIRARLEDISSVKKKLSIEIPAEVTTEEFQRVARDYRRQVRVPGFRTGKAPLPLVRRRYAGDIREEVVRKLVPESYRQAVHEQGVTPLGEPSLENLALEEGQSLRFEAHFEVEPEIALPKYKGLDVQVERPTVEDKDVEQQLERLREQNAQMVSVEDRPIESGDYAIVDLRGVYVDAEEGKSPASPIEEKEVSVRVGEPETHRAFNENLVGMSIGEEKTFDVEYDGDYPQKTLAGRRLRFTAEVTDIKRAELPDLNDDFAKDLGSFESLEDVRQRIRGDLEESARQARDASVREKLVDRLIQSTSFEVPQVLLDRRLDHHLNEAARQVVQRGVDPMRANIDWRKLREDFAPRAEREVRTQLILDRIAAAEGIEVSPEERSAEMERLAASMRQPVEKVRQYFREEGRMESLETDMRRRAAMNIIADSAKLK
jgi:trigger factor